MLTLARAVEELAGATSAEQVAHIVRTAARTLSGADGVAVVLREQGLVRYVDEDSAGPLWKGRSFPIDACISGWAMLHDQRVVIPDVFADERVPHDLYRQTFVRSCVMTPVGKPDAIACIGAYWRDIHDATPAELERLDAIARATAVALENLRLQSSLREALQRAEASDRAKSNFLTNMSHEIRTPLNGVIGALALLDDAPLPAEQAKLVRVLRSSSADLEAILTDILNFARLQSEASTIQCETFDLSTAVEEVGRLFALRFLEKKIDFRTEISPSVRGMFTGDRAGIKQVLGNLVQNALKFTDSGRVRLSVLPGEPGRIHFVVADTGCGVAEDVRERVLGGLEQADASSTRAFGGLGLGLALSKRLVELMGGSITLKSRLGAGSIFTVAIPLAPCEPLPEATAVQAGSEPLAEGPLRVLVVDDHPTNRQLLTTLLGSLGAEIVEAENGQQACDAFVEAPFDAVLMDIQMPVMDGIAATRRIREIEAARSSPRTPILMLTANVLPEHVEASRLAGADRHLAKPISPQLLFGALQSAVEGQACGLAAPGRGRACVGACIGPACAAAA